MEILSISSPPDSHSDPAQKIGMVFRIWSTGYAESKERQGSARYAGVLALIEDLVVVHDGALSKGRDQLAVNGLGGAADAIALSRRIQLGLEGYRANSGTEPVALSIVISTVSSALDPEENSSPPADHEPPMLHDLRGLLEISKPAQVLLTHDLSEEISRFKGLPLRSFPPRFGVSEYLWTSAEKLELLQSEPQLTLTAVPKFPERAQPIPAAVAASSEEVASEEPSLSLPHFSSVEQPEHGSRGSFGARAKAGVIATAVLVVGAGVWGLFSIFPSSTKVRVPASPAISQPAPPPPSRGNTAKQNASSSEPHPTAKNSKKVTQEPHTGSNLIPQAVAAGKPDCPSDAEISYSLRIAEEFRQQRNYPRAIREYERVLACQPKNQEALVGRSRVRAAMGEQ